MLSKQTNMDQETFDEIFKLSEHGYDVAVDVDKNTIFISTKVSKDESRTKMNIYTGLQLAKKSELPITHRGYVYWFIDLNECDPDYTIKVDDLKKILDTALMNASHCPVPKDESISHQMCLFTPDQCLNPTNCSNPNCSCAIACSCF